MNWLYDHKKQVIFCLALVGLIFEMVQPLFGNTVDSGLAVIFAGLLSTPLLIRNDEDRNRELDQREQTDRERARTPPPTGPTS